MANADNKPTTTGNKSATSDANTSAPKPATRKDDPKQTWIVGHDGKRYKSEDYAKTNEALGLTDDGE